MTITSAFPIFSCLVHTLGRPGGDGLAFVTVTAPNAATAESTARRLAQARFGCICDVCDVTDVTPVAA